MTTPTTQRFGRRDPGPFDLTGKKAATLADQKKEHEEARERAIRDLNEGHDYQYLQVPGHGLACVPKVVYEYLKEAFSR